MKCPKCGYLGFEHVDRCRNCGYDFSLSASIDLPELSLRRDLQTLTPLDDVALLDAVSSAPRSGVGRKGGGGRRFETALSGAVAIRNCRCLAATATSRSSRVRSPRPPPSQFRRATPEGAASAKRAAAHAYPRISISRDRAAPALVDAGRRARFEEWPATTVEADEPAQDASLWRAIRRGG